MANLYKIKYTRVVTEVVEGIIEGSDKATIQVTVEKDPSAPELTWEFNSGPTDESVYSTATITSIDEYVGQ